MSFARTSKRRREREQARRNAATQPVPPGFTRALEIFIPNPEGVTRAEVCAAHGFDPDGGDDQFAILDV